MAAAAPAAQRSLRAQAPTRLAANPGFKLAIAPQGYDCSTGTSSPYYCLGGENDSVQNGFTYGVYGVEGYAPSSTGGVGVLGYSGNSSVSNSYGVYGVTFSPEGIGVYGAGDGPAPASDAAPSSTMESTGVVGDSHSGFGILGTTEFPNASTVGTAAGVYGLDNTTSGKDNVGVVGTTTNGGYGVVALSSDSGGIRALGGLYASGTEGVGVSAVSTSSYGVQAESGSSDGVYATTSGASATAAVVGINNSSSATGYGVYGSSESDSGYGVAGVNTNEDGDGIYASGFNGVRAFSNSYPLVAANATSTDAVFYVDGSGNFYYYGSGNAELRTRSGMYASTYTPRSSSPTIEDAGSGRIVNGEGLVRLDPTLVEQMDRSSTYHVFLTPDGDTNGLYVASKTPQGFVVRETHGGHGTLAFDYRIMASVDGMANMRMALSATDPAKERGLNRPVHVPVLSRQISAKEAAFNRDVRAGKLTRIPFVPHPNLAIEHRIH